MTVETKDGSDDPFEACVHVYIRKITKCGLVVSDEKTDFKAVFTSPVKSAASTVEEFHSFEGPDVMIRRW